MIATITIHRAENGWVVQAKGECQQTREENEKERHTIRTQLTHTAHIFENTEGVLGKLRELMDEG